MCCRCIESNPSEVFHFRSVLRNMRRVYGGQGDPWRSVISIKVHSSGFVGIMLPLRCSPVSLLRVFWAPYHGMVSEELLSIPHRLQIHCIVNVNICLKGPDDKTIVFCRSLQILTKLWSKIDVKFLQKKERKRKFILVSPIISMCTSILSCSLFHRNIIFPFRFNKS